MSLINRAKGIQQLCRRHREGVNLYLVRGDAVPRILAFPEGSENDRQMERHGELIKHLDPGSTVPAIHQAMTAALDEWADAG